ncbi:MAG TPA: Flp pilus assembly protein CpaB [Vicinamibacterales bacterium]|nr:Flp pilus assembly protein CpaB [Vicinamibacterales bacterium]
MKQQRTVVVLVVALVTAGIATFAVFQAIKRMPVREVVVDTVPVVVASRNIPVGTLINADDLRVASWPAKNQVPGSFADPKDVLNRGVIETIGENEPLTTRKLAGKESGAGLPPMIPPGMRAISVRVNDVVGVAGFVVPGTRVDVLVTVNDPGDENRKQEPMSRTVVSNVQVLTQGTRYDQEESKQGGKPAQPQAVVTLAVLPLDGERIALAQNKGQISLALRNPLDVDPTVTPGVRLPALMRGPGPEPVVVEPVTRRVAPRPAPKAPAVVAAPAPPPPPAPYKVETIRAAKRSEEVVD